MKTTKLLLAAMLSASLAFGVVAQATEEKEETVQMKDVPAAVQKTAENEAKGGKILRWEKEGKNYEVVVEKGGKQWGIEIDANGKVLSKEKEEKHEH